MNDDIKYTIGESLKSSLAFAEKRPVAFGVLAILIIIAAAIFIAVVFFFLGRRLGKSENKHLQGEMIKAARVDAVKRARAVIGGQVSEQIAPFLPGFPCNAEDVRFVGKPIDFIGFPGLGGGDFDNKNQLGEVLLIEVKTGNSSLSEREKQIKKAVDEGRVRYVEYRIG